jgi:hypothetical protein
MFFKLDIFMSPAYYIYDDALYSYKLTRNIVREDTVYISNSFIKHMFEKTRDIYIIKYNSSPVHG